MQKELIDWETELKRLQDLAVLSAARDNLESLELPSLHKQITTIEAEIPGLTTEAAEVRIYLITGISPLKPTSPGTTRLQRSSRK